MKKAIGPFPLNKSEHLFRGRGMRNGIEVAFAIVSIAFPRSLIDGEGFVLID